MTSRNALDLSDFEAYFESLWPAPEGRTIKPFRWQTELLAQLGEERSWPSIVDLPTGTGKTSLIDLAVFLLAMDGFRNPSDRWMPRRVAMVVDRRVVVDQANDRAQSIANRLEAAEDGDVLASVAEGLRRLSCRAGNSPPLVSTVLRGGIVRDESWARRPDVPAIISSTVDQVGSRLLFRGYGVSNGMRPIHAGLLGNDVLFLLDEVHLARPFAETLRAVAHHRQAGDRLGMPDRWQVVELSATPIDGADDARRFPPSQVAPGEHPVFDDANEVLKRRLRASKRAQGEVVQVAKDVAKSNQQFAVACTKAAHSLLEGSARTIAVIVNRVDTARRVATLLHEPSKKGTSPEVVLLTGRMRSLDRDRVLRDITDRLKTGRTRTEHDAPLVVVSTQSIEAGADFDLDAIVTECASLDALRQRFGRVDRDGQLAQTPPPDPSIILIRSTDVEATEDDPVYGRALTNTWSWLHGLGSIDFGIAAFTDPKDARLLPPSKQAPLLFPHHLDQWVQTSLRPQTADPDVARWLHGSASSSDVADVEVVWREDIHDSLFAPGHDEDLNLTIEQEVADRIAMCPPLSSESLSVPIHAFRRWARGESDDLITTDVEAVDVGDGEPSRPVVDQLPVFRWTSRGGDIIEPHRVRPGDMVVVPSSRGGLRFGNWDPSCTDAVPDLATLAAALQRERAVIRLSPPQGDPSDQRKGRNGAGPDSEDLDVLTTAERAEEIRTALLSLASASEHPVVDQQAAAFLADSDRRLRFRPLIEAVERAEPVRSYVVTSTTPFKADLDGFGSSDGDASVGDEDGRDAPSFTGARKATLRKHLRGVGALAAAIGADLGLPDRIVGDLRLAGELHDAGKADRRFQLWLHDADQSAAAEGADEPLAKSSTPDIDRAARHRARVASGYPGRLRHELQSLAMIDDPAVLNGAHDPALVRYLVSSHHGWGRYRFEPVDDSAVVEVHLEALGRSLVGSTGHQLTRLDSGVPDAFWSLNGRYGWHGLAWLETVLRLADHERSRREQGPLASVDDKAYDQQDVTA